MLTEVAQDFVEVSQESATANDRYTVSKMRMHIMKYCMDDEAVLAELQQFDKWSFGRRLAYARKPQDSKNSSWLPSIMKPPRLGLPTGRQHQDGVPDPLQDQRQDPWIKGKTRSEQEEVKKTEGPQE